MKKLRIFLATMAALFTFLTGTMQVCATASELPEPVADVVNPEKIVNIDATKSILALGADLSDEQRASVLTQMGLTEADLPSFTLITITNEMEHQYLGSYMDASVIGSKSLSSVLITPKESGGVVVTTKNINYCTTGMYRNALLTAGVSDAEILVAAPSPMSGTAALIGAIKGYEAMTGVAVEEVTLDTAMDELITTGEIAEDIATQTGGDSEQIEELIAFVKANVAAGELKTEEDVLAVIAEGEKKFEVTLTQEQKQQIVDIMMKINELGLDPQMLIEQAEDLYGKFGTDFFQDLNINLDELNLDNLNLDGLDTEAIEEEISKQVSEGFIAKVVNAIKEFFAGIFS
ncbi:MAG: DUF1002 domain-containing protein [Lachnospiraceae bacterium]|nr:DUF1002 domain-containing protein [Lachnospiraceae bacterium]